MERFLEFAKEIANQASEIMLDNFTLSMGREWKTDNTPLTISDTKINELVINKVKASFPDHGVLGEEESYNLDKEHLWVVDPVDGTMPFSNGMPTSVFSIALVHQGMPVIAVIQDPFTSRQYYSSKNGGSFVNQQKLSVNKQSSFGPQVFIEIAAKPRFKDYSAVGILTELVDREVKVSKNYSAIYHSLPVVTGHYLASFVLLEHPWDGAALSLLTSEAGGQVTDLNGLERDWSKPGNGILVSNGLLHQELIDIVSASRG